MHLVLEFIYRLLVTLIVLVPSITAIVVACTIIYDKDFRKNKVPDETSKTPDSTSKDQTSPKE